METPAGRRREAMTSVLMEADVDEATHALTWVIGPQEVFEEQDSVYINGGGKLTVRDLCRIASNHDLERVCRNLGIKTPE